MERLQRWLKRNFTFLSCWKLVPLKALCNFSFGVLHLNTTTWYINVLIRLMEIVFTFKGFKLCNL
jgi:hypothetical protein